MSIDYTRKAVTLPGIERQYNTGQNLFADAQSVFLPDDEYARALNTLVIVCIDIVIVDQKDKILLGKRQQEPHPDWWIIGGRMRAGETFEKAAVRTIERELGVTILPSQFQLIGFYNLIWDTKAQGEGGCHTLSITLKCHVTDKQIGKFRANEEYENTKWVSPNEILSADESKYHPTLRQTIRDYLKAN